MDAIVTDITPIERGDGQLPYFIMKATATQGDANANVLDDDGFINPMACMSRSFNLTKCLFPGTQEQADAMMTSYVAGMKVRLGLFQIPSECPFNIVGADGELLCDTKTTQEEKVNTTGKPFNHNGKVIPPNGKYMDEVQVATPRVYTNVSLVLFVNKEGTCVEEGTPEEIAHRNWEAGLRKGTYLKLA